MSSNPIAVPITRRKIGTQAARAKKLAIMPQAAPPVSQTPRSLVSPNVRDAGHRLKTQQRAHKYLVGQTVSVLFNPVRPGAVSARFTIVTRMPVAGPSLQYRVRSENEPYERVVVEEDLLPVEE